MVRLLLLTVLCPVLLAACQITSITPAGRTVSQDQAKSFTVAEIQVHTREYVRSPSVAGALKSRLHDAVEKCATGSRPVNMKVRIDGFTGGSAVNAALFGTAAHLMALVELYDPRSGELISEYYGTKNTGGGGIVGMLAIHGSEDYLTQGFANDVCKLIFMRLLPSESPA